MVFETIAALIADRIECEVSEITTESSFKELGIDSLDTVDLLMQLEDELGVSVEPEESIKTVGQLVELIEAEQAKQ